MTFQTNYRNVFNATILDTEISYVSCYDELHDLLYWYIATNEWSIICLNKDDYSLKQFLVWNEEELLNNLGLFKLVGILEKYLPKYTIISKEDAQKMIKDNDVL